MYCNIMSFYNLKTKRNNTLRTARMNGLFENPSNFRLPTSVGLDMQNRRAVTKTTLQKNLSQGKIAPENIYLPSYVVVSGTNKIVRKNAANDKKIANGSMTIVKPFDKVVPHKSNVVVHVSEQVVSKFKNVASIIQFSTDIDIADDVKYFNIVGNALKNAMIKQLNGGSFKIALVTEVMFKRGDNDNEVLTSAHFHSSKDQNALPVMNVKDVDSNLSIMIAKIRNDIHDFEKNGSGWVIDHVNSSMLKFIKYSPLKGSSYINLPDWLNNKKCCINVKNTDDHCFEYAVLSAMHYSDIKRDHNRVSCYKSYVGTLNFDHISFPVENTAYEQFEKQNNIPINVFGYDLDENEKHDYDVEYVSHIQSEKQTINLLRIYDLQKSHYVWIKNLNAFVNTSTSNNSVYCCSKCLSKFHIKSAYENHIAKNKCAEFRQEAVKVLPQEGNHVCQFKNTHKMTKIPFVIYADCESMLIPVDIHKGEGTHVYQHHKVYHVGCKFVSQYPTVISDEYKQFDGEDCVEQFLTYCFDMQNKAIEIIKDEQPMIITRKQQIEFKNATHCSLCEKELGEDRVRDHDHISGYYRGPCHSSCNINYNLKNFKLPVIFHNLRGYDSHLILAHSGKFKSKISCIPNTMEKYMSFTLDRCVFLDSLQFTLTSLEKLVNSLNSAKDDSLFHEFNKSFQNLSNENKMLLRQKGIFPYDWYDSAAKLEVSSLPPKEAFHSQLGNAEIIDNGKVVNDNKKLSDDDVVELEEDYKRAQNVWKSMNCTTFYDYLSLYLKTDVVLLADVFEEYRSMCMRNYKLDPCHYYTAPGLSWDAMLRKTGAQIECFKEGQEDMLQLIEKLRGGISMITTRYAKANNKYMNEYDTSKPSSYIMYLDANNLYGYAMSQYLPIGSYAWFDSSKVDTNFIMSQSDEQEIGYLLECDLEVPAELHDYFNDYPLLPESTSFIPSPIMCKVRDDNDISKVQTNKLIPNLYNKVKYVLHYRNLKQAISLGIKLTRVHRALSFVQTPFLKAYIDLNTTERAKAKNDFEKDFFKLMNNSIFGKTCENVANRIDVKLMNDPVKFVKMSSKPYFKDFRIFSNDLVAVEMKKTMITYNRPMIVGFCILEISKTLMYDFHYNHIKKNYGNDAKLLFTDTDSLTYHIKTDDIYSDMKKDLQLFDTSDYPKDHPCYSVSNKKVIGKFKDETNGSPISEFCGLRSKMYSILLDSGKNKATAKGIKRNVVNLLGHQKYCDAILGDDKKQKCSFNMIRAYNHQLTTVKITKTSLCCYDDKRYICDDNINSLAHGHCDIKI